MSINAIQHLETDASNAVTGVTETIVYQAGVLSIFASVNGITEYRLVTSVCAENFNQLEVTITGCTNSLNNGSFVVQNVDRVNNSLKVLNINGVAQGTQNGTITAVVNIHAIHLYLI